jgi:hypothetical protein
MIQEYRGQGEGKGEGDGTRGQKCDLSLTTKSENGKRILCGGEEINEMQHHNLGRHDRIVVQRRT